MIYRIFPSIGIARLGDDDDFYLGSEVPGGSPGELQSDGTTVPVTRFKNAARDRIRKQGARFHLYESDDGQNFRPAVLPAGATVRWTVNLENKKAAVTRPANPPTAPSRPVVPAANTARVIKGGAKSVSGANAVSDDFIGNYQFPAAGGAQFQANVNLGRLRTDGQGNLIVLGGALISGAPAGTNIGASYYRNPGWYDDVADGPVTAEITLPGQAPVNADGGAWVIVGPPDFAPQINGLVTLYDVMRQVGIDDFGQPMPGRPAFDRDIAPMITAARRMQWVHASAAWRSPALTSPNLGNPAASHLQARSDARAVILSVENILAGHTSPVGPQFELRPWQKHILEEWVQGRFDATSAASASDGQDLTRAALEGAVGQGFCPGIEAGIIVLDPTVYRNPFDFRIDHGSVSAGDLTALMAQPWQADFLKCEGNWWPTQRPDLAPQAGVQQPLPWIREIDGHLELVRKASQLGFIVQQGANDVFVEVERGTVG